VVLVILVFFGVVFVSLGGFGILLGLLVVRLLLRLGVGGLMLLVLGFLLGLVFLMLLVLVL
jgi:hypothetical protein